MDLSETYKGLIVCDLSQGVAGPNATMLLAQYGADVIKVEPPEGDWARTMGERFGDHCAHSYTFNLGKRSIDLDLKSVDGQTAIRKLIQRSDVFVESFRPGVAARLGLSYEDARKLRPSIIYASLSGFGQSGPYSQRGAVDALMQGFSGMMVMNQTPTGQPHRMNMTTVDVLSGLYLFGALGAAIFRQRQSGEGGYLDISMMQSAAAFQAAKIMEFHLAGGKPKLLYMPVGCLRTRDGAISLSTMRQEHYEALCRSLGREDLISDPRFAELSTRISHGEQLMRELERETSHYETLDVLQKLHKAGVLVERIQTYGEWLRDTHVQHTNGYRWIEHPVVGQVPFVTLPGLSLPPPGSRRLRAPQIGEHMAEVMKDLDQ